MTYLLKLTLKIQLIVCAVMAIFAMIFGKVAVYSLLLGTSIFIVPNLYFTYYAFRYSAAKWAPWTNMSFLKGEMGKLMLCAVGFALVFRFVSPLQEWFLFIGFTAMIALQWLIAFKLVASMQE